MNCRERVLAVLNHEEPDRVPIWTLIDNSGALRKFAPPQEDFDALVRGEHCPEQMTRLTRSAAVALGIDVVFFNEGSPINPFPRERAGSKSEARWETEYKTAADLKRYKVEIPDYREVSAAYVPFMRQSIEALSPEVMLVDQHPTGLEIVLYHIGLQTFSLAIYDAPGEVERILDEADEYCRVYAQAYADYSLSPACQIGGDIAYKGGPMFSLDFLRKQFFPRLTRQLEPFKQAGIKVVYHSDGDVTDIIDGLIEAGVDALNPIEPTSGMDMAAIKKRYGKNLVLIGNVDANVMTLGTPEDVEREVKRCIAEAAAGGGLFIDTGAGELMPWYPLENVVAMCEAVHRFGRYPISL